MHTVQITIRRYASNDENRLFSLLEREGEEWSGYFGAGKEKYINALRSSIVYLLFEDDALCGYVRCRDDDGFGVYVYDLLVDKFYRGKAYGRRLMEQACKDFPNAPVYVLGDNYPYYEQLGYAIEGKIYIVNAQPQ